MKRKKPFLYSWVLISIKGWDSDMMAKHHVWVSKQLPGYTGFGDLHYFSTICINYNRLSVRTWLFKGIMDNWISKSKGVTVLRLKPTRRSINIIRTMLCCRQNSCSVLQLSWQAMLNKNVQRFFIHGGVSDKNWILISNSHKKKAFDKTPQAWWLAGGLAV